MAEMADAIPARAADPHRARQADWMFRAGRRQTQQALSAAGAAATYRELMISATAIRAR
jgi:hypothetical protein